MGKGGKQLYLNDIANHTAPYSGYRVRRFESISKRIRKVRTRRVPCFLRVNDETNFLAPWIGAQRAARAPIIIIIIISFDRSI